MDYSILKADSSLSIKISRGNIDTEFTTNVIDVLDGAVVVSPILYDGKMVNFNIAGVKKQVSTFYQPIGKMVVWEEVEIKAGYYKKKSLCHVIYLRGDGKEINRRRDYRQYVGIEGRAEHFGADRVPVLVRDVSNNGIGLIVDDSNGFENGRRMIVNFTDNNGKYRFALECKQVRFRVLNNGRTEIGCLVVNPPQAYSSYVAFKQLAEKRRMLGY